MKPGGPAIADTDSRVARTIAGYKEEIAKEDLSSVARAALKTTCNEASLAAYRAGKFEEAIDKFAHYLALVETEREDLIDMETRATLCSNIAVCLHHQSEWELAQTYYDEALKLFGAVVTSSLAWLYYGDVKQKKMDHINGQAALLAEKKLPTSDTYLDANGYRRDFASRDASYFSATDWYNWFWGIKSEAEAQPAETPAP